jgi:hypothetical protein
LETFGIRAGHTGGAGRLHRASDKLNEEIIGERHRALNWLIRYMDQEWDEITTDT